MFNLKLSSGLSIGLALVMITFSIPGSVSLVTLAILFSLVIARLTFPSGRIEFVAILILSIDGEVSDCFESPLPVLV